MHDHVLMTSTHPEERKPSARVDYDAMKELRLLENSEHLARSQASALHARGLFTPPKVAATAGGGDAAPARRKLDLESSSAPATASKPANSGEIQVCVDDLATIADQVDDLAHTLQVRHPCPRQSPDITWF